ncbi:MAG: arsenosugar biosynthesis arsenite methyltransferase ArsM [Planctomycetota bacterium]
MSTDAKSYHVTVQEVYRDAALKPATNLCCVPQAPRYLPGLHIPDIMHEMNYGCGTTVHLQDMRKDQTALYVGVGGGIEALQLAYFCRRPAGVIAIDPVAEMREAARKNLERAAEANDWFDPSFVDIRDGDALDLPVDDDAVGFAAQNCLFNIFKTDGDLEKALGEMHRVLGRAGRLVMSDPVTPRAMPARLVADETLRAACISGCLTLEDYLDKIVAAGFGAIEVRSRKPYRMLDAKSYELDSDLLLETVEVAAFKTPVPEDGPCIFTGRDAVYTGPDETFNDGKGHLLHQNLPMPVCDKTANALSSLGRDDLVVTASTWHYQGGGCC